MNYSEKSFENTGIEKLLLLEIFLFDNCQVTNIFWIKLKIVIRNIDKCTSETDGKIMNLHIPKIIAYSFKKQKFQVLSKSKLKSDKEKFHLMSERNVLLNNLEHSFLVSLHYAFQSPSKLYFVLDYVNGGELFYHLQRDRHFSEDRAKFYAAEIACALGYLHSRNILYRWVPDHFWQNFPLIRPH